MKIAVIGSRNRNNASCRLRWFNFADDFRARGIACRFVPVEEAWLGGLLGRWTVPVSDIVIVHKKPLFRAALVGLKERCKKLVFDLDDPYWLPHPSLTSLWYRHYNMGVRARWLDRSLKHYDLVTVNCRPIGEYIQRFHRNVREIPECPSDPPLEKSVRDHRLRRAGTFILGWTGLASNACFLKAAEPYLHPFFASHPDARLVVVSDGPYRSSHGAMRGRIINVPWDLRTEESYVKSFDVGLLPLVRCEWSRCNRSVKGLYYLSRGVPLVSTAWGAQLEYVRNGVNGFLVWDDHAWPEVLGRLYADSGLRARIADEGYETFRERFSKEVVLARYLDLFSSLLAH